MPNLGGVFIVLLGGMIMSIFLAFGEFFWENRLKMFLPEVQYCLISVVITLSECNISRQNTNDDLFDRSH